MRIKKKYILEAISKLTTNDVEAAKEVVDAASKLEKTAEPVFGKEKAKDIVGNLLAPDNKLEEVGADEYEKEQKAREELGIKPVNKTKIVKGDLPFDEPKSKKRIKEVIKVKDIKK